jgi:hypothetical protein
MSFDPRTIASFRSSVACQRDPSGPLGLTLTGTLTDFPDEPVSLAFTAAASQDIPDTLQDVTVDRVGASQYRIRDLSSQWLVHAATVHLHRDVATRFYRAVPSRKPSWGKRVFWRIVLATLRNPVGKRLLLALRR